MPIWTPLVLRPDLDTSWEVAPGALVTCSGFLPTRRGSYASWGCEDAVHSYTSAVEPIAAGIVTRGSGIGELYIFNKQSIFSTSGNPSAATDRSSTTYSSSTVGWDWTTFGDIVLATNYYNAIQKAVLLGDTFANLGGSPPKAQCIATLFGLVVIANLDTGSAIPDGWACSDLEDPEDWTPTATNYADTGRLYDTPGAIRSLVRLRDTLIAYKDDSIYVGEFVGDPTTTILAWRLISDKVGCSALHGVAVLNDCHYFMHRTGFYVFDGSAVRQIGREVSQQVTGFMSASGINFTKHQATVDAAQNSVFFGFARGSDTALNYWLVYNTETGRWSGTLGQIFTHSASGYPTCVVQCTVSDLIAFYSGLATVAPLTSAVLCGPNGSGKTASFYTRYGGAATAVRGNEMLTGVIGNGDDNQTITRIKPRFISYTPDLTPECYVSRSKQEGAPPLVADASPVQFVWNPTEQCFDGTVSGRYFQIDMYVDNACEIGGLYYDGPMKPAGKK